MLLKDYQNDIILTIQKYVDEGWITAFNFSVDYRTDYLGFIQGNLDFIDNSSLFFKEYIDLQGSPSKISYSFHYQDHHNNLIFRYDNAKHKPDLGYLHHKHINNEIIASTIPTLEQVLMEIIQNYLIKL
jgi:hypothetical protein